MGLLDGKVAIVTGASRGIGAEIARRFGAEGAAVAVAARTTGPGQSPLAGTIGETAEAINAAGGIAVAIPAGYAGLVLPRSGLALSQGVTVLNAPGLVDAGYRGELKVLLVNHGDKPVTVRRGERVAQLVVQSVERAEPIEVGELPASERGAGGFGSTGV